MTFLNEAVSDRAVRILGGTLLLSLAWRFATGTVAIMLIAVGAIALVTGLAGWCPAYTALGVSTRKTPVRGCPNCDANYRV